MNKAFEKILDMLEEEKRKRVECIANGEPEEIKSMNEFNMIQDVIKIIQEVAEEHNGGWISVNDRLPDKAGSYLVIGKSGGATVTRWYMPSEFYPEGHFGGNSSDYIRYWMPRPEPPKERD